MRRYTGRALLAASALALQAYTSLSPAGAAFLALFIAWGLIATRPAAVAPSPHRGGGGGVTASAAASLALWCASAAASCALLLLQLLLPLLASAGAAGAAGPGSAAWWALGLRDLSSSGPWRILAVLAPPLLCFLASLAEAQDAGAAVAAARRRRRHGHGHPPPQPPHAHADPHHPDSRHILSATPHHHHLHQPPDNSTEGPHGGSSLVHGTGSASHSHDGSGGGGGGAAAAAGLLVALAALLWPAAFNLPWLLLASAAVGGWALRLAPPPPAVAPLLRLSQSYCAAVLVVLYGWQVAPPESWPPRAARAARALGLYRLDPAAVPLYDFVPQVMHLAALTALYGALGFAAAWAATDWARRREARRGTDADGAADADVHRRRRGGTPAAATTVSLTEPLLPPPSLPAASGSPPAPAPAGAAAVGTSSAAATAATAVPPSADAQPHPHRRQQQQGSGPSAPHPEAPPAAPDPLGRAATAAAALCRHPGVAAVALAGLSLVEVSVVGGALLAVGMWTLLAPGRYGRRLLRVASPALTVLLLTWNAAVYVITCLSASYPALLPPVLHSLGLFMYDSPPPVVLPLAGQAAAILAMAGLARSRRQYGGADGAGATPDTRSAAGGGGRTEGGAGSTLGLSIVLASYHALHVIVPLSWILLGSYRLDLLHGGYLVWVLLYCGSAALQLSPDPRVGAVLPDVDNTELYGEVSIGGVSGGGGGDGGGGGGGGSDSPSTGGAVAAAPPPQRRPPFPAAPPAHRRLRLFASLHLMALYGAMCGQLPGLRALQRPQWEGALRLVGLWDPARTCDLLPLFGALVLATAHAVAGKTLAAAAGAATGGGGGDAQQHGPPPPPQVYGWLLAAGGWLGRTAASAGAPLIAVLLYVLVLYDMRPGLAGLGYLALGLPLLLSPPLRAQYGARLRVSHHSSGPSSSLTQEPRPRPYLSAAGASGLAGAGRWLGPAALAAYGAADLFMSYAAATLAEYAPPAAGLPPPALGLSAGGSAASRMLLSGGGGASAATAALVAAAVRVPSWWWRLVDLVYGGPAWPPGRRLVLSLGRPAVLLLALQLYRWAFAATAVSSWLRRTAEEAQSQAAAEGGADGAPPPPPPLSPAPGGAVRARTADNPPPPPASHLRRRRLRQLRRQESLTCYASWAGLPALLLLLPARGLPPPYAPPSERLGLPPALAGWLGLQGTGPLVPWALFGALLACLVQVNFEVGASGGTPSTGPPPPPTTTPVTPSRRWHDAGGRAGDGGGDGGGGGGLWWWRLRRRRPSRAGGPSTSDNDLEAPLLPQPLPMEPPAAPPPLPYAPHAAAEAAVEPETENAAGAEAGTATRIGGGGGGEAADAGWRRPAQLQLPPSSVAPPGAAAGGRIPTRDGIAAAATALGGGGGGRTLLFSPMESWAQPYWGVLDWARYYLVSQSA
ncbi:hypothetical protein GPECTOR_58g572 [Gonium pectorale]|uniref:Piezo non-specific cation channel R-Ras-binding domain-containing protein n=1 Tax=Gonium pectorale TaxID=33097 RepID=A0A150G5S9_GONPE|nr:hypothetical protein GPECTOR_58g572 [Gonium pectorale]|eukprot:KXZ45123.1 hypothetical protein GPECTOR_58g572 [Gonium pectorale]